MDSENVAQLEIPKETLDFFNGDDLRARVFYEKYTLRDFNGNIMEKVPTEMWNRLAKEISGAEETESKKSEWKNKFFWMLDGFKFVPGGRILFGAGQARKVTLLNCYVIPIKGDTIEDIFEWCKEAARTYSFSGGVGTDISILRPKDTPVHNSAMKSTGAVSFMNIMSETTGTIGQAGRRGALMITIDVSHPDILDFIKVKRNLKNVKYANISIKITNEFMKAVEDDTDFTLRFENNVVKRIEKKIKARELWKEIIDSARNWAEPGLIFWDNMVKFSPSEYNGMNIITTNPCAEQPLQAYGACDLGHINLKEFVKNPFLDNASLDLENLEKVTRYGVRFLDDVLTYNKNKHPLKEQAEATESSRRIGLGIMGLADMLAMLKIKYDSDAAIDFVDNLMSSIKNIAYDESIEISKEKGSFKLFDAEKHLSMPFVEKLNSDIKEKIKQYGLRNVAILSVAPTGSGSLLAGTSSGIEPIFAFSYTRRSESLSQEYFKVYHPLVSKYMNIKNISDETDLPNFFVPAHKINADFRIRMQAVIQKHIDSAISSTVNLPEETNADEVSKIYFQAWKSGCKGITIYREGSREGVLITDEKEKENKTKKAETSSAVIEWKRPKMIIGQTIKLKMPTTSVYVTVNTDKEDVKEVFINVGKSGSEDKSYSEAIGRLISIYMQNGGDIDTVIRSLKGIHGNNMGWDNGMKLFSVPDAIAKALEIVTGKNQQTLIPDIYSKQHEMENALHSEKMNGSILGIEMCPECQSENLVNDGGCVYCNNCGYSKCS
jgi:ribonucleoside-diphosphate reductase alpha chain